MKKVKILFWTFLIFILCLFSACSENKQDEPSNIGYLNDIPYYRIKYPEGKDLTALFGLDNYIQDFQISCPVSVHNPNQRFTIMGWNITDDRGIIYSLSKDYFIVYYDDLSSDSFSKIAISMMSDYAMEYKDGLQYIEDLLIE